MVVLVVAALGVSDGSGAYLSVLQKQWTLNQPGTYSLDWQDTTGWLTGGYGPFPGNVYGASFTVDAYIERGVDGPPGSSLTGSGGTSLDFASSAVSVPEPNTLVAPWCHCFGAAQMASRSLRPS